MADIIVLDLKGLKCPLPALKTRKALASRASGDRIEVRCTDPMAMIDIPHLLQETGDAVASVARSDDEITFLIIKA